MSRSASLAFVALAAALAACGDPAGPRAGLFRGHYRGPDFEVSDFRPCGSGETWWVILEAAAGAPHHQPAWREAAAVGAGRVYVEWWGRRGRGARFGHGDYERTLRVDSVAAVRAPAAGDCR